MKSDPKGTAQTLDAIIKNTYRTLMSRGMKGCYIYCTDPETASFFRSRLDDLPRRGETESKSKVIPFPLVRGDKLRPYINALPLVDLKMAAGLFSKFRTADEDDFHWVAPEELRRIDKDMFVAQVVGESMNNQIPNGAWCVFRLAPRGSKAGRVVLAELHGIGDPENGGAYTVKVYRSEKYADDHGHQQKSRVTLEPNSTDSAFQPLVFDSKSGQEVQVIAELVQVLGKLAL